MLKTLNELGDEKTEKYLLKKLQEYYDEVRVIFPKLPGDLQIYFDNTVITYGQGCGGFAYDKDIITIGFDMNFPDKKQQLDFLRQTLFHESYHLAQGYHLQMSVIAPIEETVYEGAATIFERDVAGGDPPYGIYAGEPVGQWFTQIQALDSSYDRDKWKFWDDEEKIGWKLYKTGVYIVDKAIAKTGKTIIELNALTAQEILNLAAI